MGGLALDRQERLVKLAKGLEDQEHRAWALRGGLGTGAGGVAPYLQELLFKLAEGFASRHRGTALSGLGAGVGGTCAETSARSHPPRGGTRPACTSRRGATGASGTGWQGLSRTSRTVSSTSPMALRTLIAPMLSSPSREAWRSLRSSYNGASLPLPTASPGRSIGLTAWQHCCLGGKRDYGLPTSSTVRGMS